MPSPAVKCPVTVGPVIVAPVIAGPVLVARAAGQPLTAELTSWL